LLGWYGEGASIAAGARYDHHDRFGGELSLGANASLFLAGNLRLRASYGEGFKAPTLFQLHSDFGNVTLRPERSRSVDFGIDIGERNSRFKGSLTLFRRDSRDLIDFVSCSGMTNGICTDRPFGTYDNVGEARAQGLELELAAKLGETLSASASYSYIETRDRTPGGANRGNWLARRPRHAVSVSLDWTSPVGVVLGGDVRLVGESFDDAGNFTRIDGHAIADLRASWPVSEQIELYGRIENVTDAGYVEVAGYSTQGRATYVGARARF
jgi:vitamin B12 transporter